MIPFVVLVSGHGSTLQALIDATETGLLPKGCIKGVISNVSNAYGLERAQLANIPNQVLSHTEFSSRENFDTALVETILKLAPDAVVVLAGFMRVLSPVFIAALNGRILNIHPSLLPAYKGLHTYERALAAGEQVHGTSVHMVDATLDGGPIIAQAKVSILPNDTVNTLKDRVQAQERWLYPRVLRLISDHRLQLSSPPLFQNQPIAASGLNITSSSC